MSWNLVRLAEVPPTPWRNGGGTTRELLAWPGAHDWRVRLSVAEVAQDGPFSSFPGVQRWFAVLGGAGVQLRLPDAQHRLTMNSAPFAFDGGMPVDCTLLDGPTQDFNLMTRGGTACMERVRGHWAGSANAMSLVAIHVQGTRATATFGNEKMEMEPHTLAWRWLEASADFQLAAQDALWMEVRP